MKDIPEFTLEELRQAGEDFRYDFGHVPCLMSGDCSRYFGWKERTARWLHVAYYLKHRLHQGSLRKFWEENL